MHIDSEIKALTKVFNFLSYFKDMNVFENKFNHFFLTMTPHLTELSVLCVFGRHVSLKHRIPKH